MRAYDRDELKDQRPKTAGRTRRSSEDGLIRVGIAARLAAARRAAGLTQIAVSDRLDRPRSWIGKIEAGRRGLLFSEAIELAELYGVNLDDLAPPGTSRRGSGRG